MVKAIAVVFIIVILATLGFGLFSLMTDTREQRRTARALTWRIGLSVLLIALLFIGYLTGMVHPHNLGR